MATSDDVSELKEEITQLRDGMQSLKTAHAEQQHQMQTREAELTKEVRTLLFDIFDPFHRFYLHFDFPVPVRHLHVSEG